MILRTNIADKHSTITGTGIMQPLESRRGIAKLERHTLTLIKTHTTQGEGGVLFGFFIHKNLPKPRIEIKSRIIGHSS